MDFYLYIRQMTFLDYRDYKETEVFRMFSWHSNIIIFKYKNKII